MKAGALPPRRLGMNVERWAREGGPGRRTSIRLPRPRRGRRAPDGALRAKGGAREERAAWRARRPLQGDCLRRAPRRGEPVPASWAGANLRLTGRPAGARHGGPCPLTSLLRWHSATVTPGGSPRTPPKAQPNSEPREKPPAAGGGVRARGPGER